MINNNLKTIDGCTDGWDCPHATECNQKAPDTCPLYDPQFNMDQGDELDTVMFDA